MGVSGLFSLYQAQSARPATVLSISEDAEGLNATVCSVLKIQVEFNMLSGASRRPIAHTCTPSLELPSTYATYTEFVSEFRRCMASDFSWIMDGV